MNEITVVWVCPNCNTSNSDDFAQTVVPMCESCEIEFFWGDVLDDDTLIDVNTAFALMQGED